MFQKEASVNPISGPEVIGSSSDDSFDSDSFETIYGGDDEGLMAMLATGERRVGSSRNTRELIFADLLTMNPNLRPANELFRAVKKAGGGRIRTC